MANFTVGRDELPRKLEVLAQHCADLDRDIDTINKTSLGMLIVGRTMEEAEAKRSSMLAERGLPPWDQLDDGLRAMLSDRFVVGDADTAGEQLQSLLDMGLDGFTFNMPADGWDVECVALAGEILNKALP
jgi:alkanesulfonate monooxygenase SsuD/methylene tetrahydromethanopterin reductase-like flavin-dependent oxidoreductase (luciferase family)